MSGPLVALPMSLDAGGALRAGRRTHYLDARYAAALSEAGAVPLHVSHEASPEAVAGQVRGLLVPGGDDFLPGAPYPPAVRFESPDLLSFAP